ncbi:aspartic peptidase domain-containing protein [Schizophyllum amplum]|uniref:Aspartic peptidase domain-containing protein n=1 Tax=Schizophyllum amplum TaxID=97359 RepID=A0A550CPH7_9AGAR|nr:aspartic peptidase domain-containing protein [Auriculariopsis ampla]
MRLNASFIPLFLAVVVATKPVLVDRSPITIPLLKELNVTSGHNLVQSGKQRAQLLRNQALKKSGQAVNDALIDEPVINEAVVYLADIGVGSPATTYHLIVDTGSSNTWIGAGTKYVETTTSDDTGSGVSVSYGSGYFSGEEYTDTVTITDGLVLTSQSIGVASRASGFSGYDGILGIGPTDLTEGTLSNSNAEIPTVVDTAFSEGLIDEQVISVYFEPTIEEEVENGELTWGGVDNSKYTGEISYTPVTSTYPASYYWGIDQSIIYGDSVTILDTNAGITDTGTTLLYLATDAYDAYVKATGGEYDNSVGLLRITSAQFDALESLFFSIGGVTYELTPNAQIWPRSLNTAIGGSEDGIYLVVADIGSPSGQGLDFINGYVFLERFYSVYDSGNSQIGFATTPFTNATSN